ncbi:MAG TPA: glycerophosphodiester phosphodiesterase [Burkholderiaceae bacterium]|nr:glycerophosphodiester phosphodiesterase [Burkholderiaceae bacterium]
MPSWSYPRLLAHRGGGSLAPENTLPACDVGLQYGYRAAEVDAVLCADEVPVLLHDATLDRTTDGRGSVAAKPAADLAQLDAGSWFGPQFAGTRIPTLLQALHHCHQRGIWLNVEIKPVPGQEVRTGEIVAETIVGFRAQAAASGVAAPLVSSFSRVALEAARRRAPQLARGLLFSRIVPDWRDALQTLECASLHCDHRRLTPALARQITTAGYGLLCYTVNDPHRARTLWSWGVDAICTDRIDRIRPDDDPASRRRGEE